MSWARTVRSSRLIIRLALVLVVEDRLELPGEHKQRSRLGQRTVLSVQLALQLLDATPILLGLLRAGSHLLLLDQRLRGPLAPLLQLLPIHPVLAAPDAARGLRPSPP
jgi:hypothetical protein